MGKTYIGIDNGTTGTIGVIHDHISFIIKTPTINQLSYTKKEKWVDVIDFDELLLFFNNLEGDKFALLEKPYTNIDPRRFHTVCSAFRALEAVNIALRQAKIPFQYISSTEWQKKLFPQGIKGDKLKKASLDVAKRLFPNIIIPDKLKDCDGLLIAEFAKRMSY